MPDWQERITRESAPALRVEHELRYALAAPLIADAALWCDLGCGSGVAAGRAIGDRTAERTLLVDVNGGALEQAGRELPGNVTTLEADLSDDNAVARVRAELLEHSGHGIRVVTCFETVEHLQTFPPLISLLTELAEQHGFTVFMSVPNDAFWSLENPHHPTMWGEGSFEELRSLLPADHIVIRQVPLQGSALARDGDAALHETQVAVDPEGVASHHLAVFGPEQERVVAGARVVQADLEDKRRWERQRESDLVYHVAYVTELEGEVAKLRAEVQAMSAELADWRSYIHDLERKLGLPLSGVERGEQPPSADAAT
jgi:hypothetical protein